MSMQDPISDMLTRIRNAQMAFKQSVVMPSSTLKVSIAEVLKDEGYIVGYAVDKTVKPELNIELKYHNQQPVIVMLKRVSKPGRRLYSGLKSLPKVLGGLGNAVISTSKGLMTAKKARAANLGGEVLFFVA